MSAPLPKDGDAGSPPAADSKQLAKMVLDLAPLLIFFAAYMASDIYVATGALMAATVISMIVSRLWLGHISATLVLTTILVVGGSIALAWDVIERPLEQGLADTAPAWTSSFHLARAEQLEDAPLIGAAWHAVYAAGERAPRQPMRGE